MNRRAAALPPKADGPESAAKPVVMREVQVEALVVMRIIKHSTQVYPSIATGSLVGMDDNGVLQVTNCFSLPTVDNSNTDGHESLSAASAPRAKSSVAYQNEMIRNLKEVNVDAQNVGWYMSTNMGGFINQNTIENQFFYQKEPNERSTFLVYDISRSNQGAVSLRAFRLSPAFMAQYKEGKFTTEALTKSGLRYQDVLTEIPVRIHNSHLLTSLLHQLPTAPVTNQPELPRTLAQLEKQANMVNATPLVPNFDSLDLSIDPFLEKTCDLLLDSIETHQNELNDYQFFQRSTAREQAKITQWQAKRKAENAQRTATNQALLPEDEWQRLFKLPTEPSRLETLLNSRQIEQYSRQADGFAAGISGKMFGVRSTLFTAGELEQ